MDLLTRMWDLVFVSGPKRTSKCGWTEDGHMTRVICNGHTDKGRLLHTNKLLIILKGVWVCA